MIKVGFVGWRGMVGSVLMQRMVEESDFTLFEPVFFFNITGWAKWSRNTSTKNVTA